MTTLETQARKIAPQLSRLRRDALIEVRPIFDGDFPHTIANLISMGLVDYKRGRRFSENRHLSITPLGLAVRDILKEQNDGQS